MIRKAVIVVLTLAATLSLLAGVVGFDAKIPNRPLFVSGERAFAIVFARYGVHLWRFTVVDQPLPTPRLHWYPFPKWGLLRMYHDERGFTKPPSATNAGVHEVGERICVPLLLLVLLFGSYPLIAFIRGPLRRWRRRKRGKCQNCGYNLTGNVTGVCSECGTAVR